MINADDKLSDQITLKKVAILMTHVVLKLAISFIHNKAFQEGISKELIMPVTWHPPIGWLDWCMSEADKKNNKTTFY